MAKIGIIQGRLLPPEGDRLQSFPAGRWLDEFALAASVPLDSIEWIYEVHGAAENPIATAGGIEQLETLTNGYGVAVRSVCADYFMDRPFVRVTESERDDSEEVLVWLLGQCGRRQIERVVLPFVDRARITDAGDRQVVGELLSRLLRVLDRTGVELHLETDLPPREFAELLAGCDHAKIRVNYDTGNSASLGYWPREEFAAYGRRIGSVHIKDRIRGGGTVPLGAGDTDFTAVFDELRRIRYDGDFILQAARGESGNEVAWARRNRAFVEPLVASLATS
jgi:hexulose-6-phosphate isomerase